MPSVVLPTILVPQADLNPECPLLRAQEFRGEFQGWHHGCHVLRHKNQEDRCSSVLPLCKRWLEPKGLWIFGRFKIQAVSFSGAWLNGSTMFDWYWAFEWSFLCLQMHQSRGAVEHNLEVWVVDGCSIKGLASESLCAAGLLFKVRRSGLKMEAVNIAKTMEASRTVQRWIPATWPKNTRSRKWRIPCCWRYQWIYQWKHHQSNHQRFLFPSSFPLSQIVCRDRSAGLWSTKRWPAST